VERVQSNEWPVVYAAHLIGIAAGFVTMLGLLTMYLPTTPKRAALVALIFHLLLLGIAIGTALVIYLVAW
jgi:hypothetical protein